MAAPRAPWPPSAPPLRLSLLLRHPGSTAAGFGPRDSNAWNSTLCAEFFYCRPFVLIASEL